MDRVINLENPHLAELIFTNLDTSSLPHCLAVSETWKKLGQKVFFDRCQKEEIDKLDFEGLKGAFASGNYEKANVLLNYLDSKNIKIDITDYNKLISACQQRHVFLVKIMFLDNPKLNVLHEDVARRAFKYGFIDVCEHGHKIIANRLMNHPKSNAIDWNVSNVTDYRGQVTDYRGQTVFQRIFNGEHHSQQPDPQVIQLLLDHSKSKNIDTHFKDGFGRNEFMIAYMRKYYDIMELFVKYSESHSIDLNARFLFYRGSTYENVFSHACAHGNLRAVELFLQYPEHIKLNARDELGRTGLQLAYQNGQIKVFSLLIKNSKAKHIDVISKDELHAHPQKMSTLSPEILALLEENWQIMKDRASEILDGLLAKRRAEDENTGETVDTDETNEQGHSSKKYKLEEAETYEDMKDDLEYMEETENDDSDTDE